jgi:hypothetical protein
MLIAGCEVLLALSTESAMFWAVNPYISDRPQHTGRLKLGLSLVSAYFMLSLIFHPEDGGDILLRNVENPPKYNPESVHAS